MRDAPNVSDFEPEMRDALMGLQRDAAQAIARTSRWAAQNSGSLEISALKAMANVLEEAFGVLPGPVERIALAPFERVLPDGRSQSVQLGEALRLTVRPHARLRIALTGHYDTVFAQAHPFQMVEEDGDALRGPGVADMKGGLGVMLDALRAFEQCSFAGQLGYTVLLSPDEEIGSPGSAPLLAQLGAQAQFGMTYEPATPDGFLIDARAGSGNFALVVKGRSAHVGRAFAEGRNAVAAAARFAAAIDAMNGQMDGVTINVGTIEGGGPVNIVPEHALVRFNVRAPGVEQARAAAGRIEEAARSIEDGSGLTSHLHGGFTRPPKPRSLAQSAAAAIVADAGARLGLRLEFRSSGGVCEGNNLAAAGCPNIDTLGVVGGGLHSSEEFALKESFAERAQLSLVILQALATGRADLAGLRA